MTSLTVDIVGVEQDILAVSKPVGMNTIQAVGWVNGLPRLYDVVCSVYPQARFLNRIDRDTSGLVLFGLTKAARSHLSKIWMPAKDEGTEIKKRKIYLCVIDQPDWDKEENSNPLKDPKSDRMLPATTTFEVLYRRSDGVALVQAELASHGRTHQIRRHLQQLGYPIHGDTKYGGAKSEARQGQLLHAWRNEILAPDGGWIVFQSVVPEDMGFSVEGGTCLQKIPVIPLTEEQKESERQWSKRKRMDVLRHDGESYQDFQARKRALMDERDGVAAEQSSIMFQTGYDGWIA